MPHLILEYSGNVRPDVELPTLLKALHERLAGFETIKAADIKVRGEKRELFHVADGSPRQAFAHLRVDLLAGRPVELKKRIGESLLALLKESFATASRDFQLGLSLEVRDMDRETYFKPSST